MWTRIQKDGSSMSAMASFSQRPSCSRYDSVSSGFPGSCAAEPLEPEADSLARPPRAVPLPLGPLPLPA
eukprot:2342247-Pyramimonas_sp.AAC.1